VSGRPCAATLRLFISVLLHMHVVNPTRRAGGENRECFVRYFAGGIKGRVSGPRRRRDGEAAKAAHALRQRSPGCADTRCHAAHAAAA
jgi:hypothetical protein